LKDSTIRISAEVEGLLHTSESTEAAASSLFSYMIYCWYWWSAPATYLHTLISPTVYFSSHFSVWSWLKYQCYEQTCQLWFILQVESWLHIF